MHLLYISLVQLSHYKIFLGHSIFNTMLLSSWLIFKLKGNTTILNLYNTIKMLKLSYNLLKNIINKGFPFWFVNFDLTKEEIIKYSAFQSGEFYVTRRWIRGLISNFFVITKAYRKFLIKKEFIESNKVKDLYDKWIFTRFTWPRAIFISNVQSSFIVSKETASARVPTIALVDTDVKTFLYNIPVGCNDDSLESIAFMNGLMSQYVLRSKYKRVLIWYYFNRNVKRFNTLLEWLKKMTKLKKNIKYKINVKDIRIPNMADYYIDIRKGLNFFFGRSYNYNLLNKKKNIENDKYFLDFFYDLNKVFIYNRLKVLTYKISSYKYRLKFRRYHFLNEIEGVSSFKSFLNNFIKYNGLSSRVKPVKIKKRIKMARKNVSKYFKVFFHFIFFFYLNRFKIVIDSYNKCNFNLLNIANIYKVSERKRKKYKRRSRSNDNINRQYKCIYVFRYKSKKIYKRNKKKKDGYITDSFNNLNKRKQNMSFLFFYWKYFIMFLGLKLRNNMYNLNRKYALKKKI